MLLSLAQPLLLSPEKTAHASPRVGTWQNLATVHFPPPSLGGHWTHLQLLQVWPLHADHSSQQLVLQAIPGHSEVDQGGLSLQLGLVVRICQLGVQYEPELGIVFTLFVSEFNAPGT